ncbi:hypothetical protein [Halovulum sp. GXIMD14793]
MNDLKSMCCGEKGEVVLNFESAYWMLKQGRACVLYIFSLVASLLVASEDKTPSTLGCCVLRHMQRGVAGEVTAALVLAMRAPVALSFLAVKSGGCSLPTEPLRLRRGSAVLAEALAQPTAVSAKRG